MRSHGDCRSLLMGIRDVTSSFENGLLVPYKAKSTIQSSHPTPSCLPRWAENLCPSKSFIYHCQKLKATKIAFNEWMNKQIVVLSIKYLAMKRKELPTHEKTWRNIKCTLQKERNLHSRAKSLPTVCIVSTAWHSGKGKSTETVKGWVVAKGSGGRRDSQEEHRGAWGWWNYCSMLYWCIIVYMYHRIRAVLYSAASDPHVN